MPPRKKQILKVYDAFKDNMASSYDVSIKTRLSISKCSSYISELSKAGLLTFVKHEWKSDHRIYKLYVKTEHWPTYKDLYGKPDYKKPCKPLDLRTDYAIAIHKWTIKKKLSQKQR